MIRFGPFWAITILCLAAGFVVARADDPKNKATDAPATEAARKAIERGLTFLQTDATDWRKEHKCASCHHGTMTVWAFSEARSRGYAIDDETYRDVVNWTKERLANIDQPRDTRPGYSMVNTPALYLSAMALALPAQNALTPDEVGRIAAHLLRHQEADGSWAWSSAPLKNRPPPVFESDEVATLLAYIDLGPHVSAETRDARGRGAAWLERQKPGESTQARALQLFRDVRAGKPPAEIEASIARLLALQHDDGGWGQEKTLASDAYATGQALYFLSIAGVSTDRPEIERGAAFLVASQEEDGSWPMTPRAHPGTTPMTSPVPITYFGSAWATMGLLRSLPAAK
jgi:hypothetical protein